MDNRKRLITNAVFGSLLENFQGGGFVVVPSGFSNLLSNPADFDQTAVVDIAKNGLSTLKPFELSIYNPIENINYLQLIFLINPSDITIGNVFVAQDSYTREGWLATLWGKGQPTILANGSTAGFYLNGVGLAGTNRRYSLSFRNFMSMVAMYKNGGYYFLKGSQNRDLFGFDRGRVISVMDLLKIGYDGTEYTGSFNNLTIDESAETPFRFTYNFEFIISGLRGEPVDGHIHMKKEASNEYNNVDNIILKTSGNYGFEEIVQLDTNDEEIKFLFSTKEDLMSGEALASGSGNKPVTYGALPDSIKENGKTDGKKYAEYLQNNPDISVRAGFIGSDGKIDPNKVCIKRNSVKKMLANSGWSELQSILKSKLGTGFTEDQSEAIFMLETKVEPDGSWKYQVSESNAVGPAQIIPATFMGINNNPDLKTKFYSYMKACKFNKDYIDRAFSEINSLGKGEKLTPYNPVILGSDVKFSLATHLFLGATDFTRFTKGENKHVSNTNDPAAAMAVVTSTYNNGGKIFTNGDPLPVETAEYSRTAVEFLGVKCKSGL